MAGNAHRPDSMGAPGVNIPPPVNDKQRIRPDVFGGYGRGPGPAPRPDPDPCDLEFIVVEDPAGGGRS